MFKDFDKFPVTPGDFRHSRVARSLVGKKVNERIPKVGSAHGETDEAFDASRRSQPFAHFFFVFAASKNDASNFVPSAAMCYGHDLFAVFMTIQSLDLPDIRFDASVLQLVDSLNHQLGAKL